MLGGGENLHLLLFFFCDPNFSGIFCLPPFPEIDLAAGRILPLLHRSEDSERPAVSHTFYYRPAAGIIKWGPTSLFVLGKDCVCRDAFSSFLAHFWTTISVFPPRDCNTTRYRKRRKRGGIKCKSATEHTQNVFSRKIKPNSQAISESQSFSGKPFFCRIFK